MNSMAVITSTEISASERYTRVRNLAGVSTQSYTDTMTKDVIENADAIARSYFTADDTLPTGSGLLRLITVSNLIASTLIRSGIDGGADNESAIRHQTTQYMDIVKAHNSRHTSQNKQVVMTATGINRAGGTFFDQEAGMIEQ